MRESLFTHYWRMAVVSQNEDNYLSFRYWCEKLRQLQIQAPLVAEESRNPN